MIETVIAAEEHLEPGSLIITTTSVQSFDLSFNGLCRYKGAVSNFMVSLSSYFASKGVRVNDVAPGPSWMSLQLDNGKWGQIPEFDLNTPSAVRDNR